MKQGQVSNRKLSNRTMQFQVALDLALSDERHATRQKRDRKLKDKQNRKLVKTHDAEVIKPQISHVVKERPVVHALTVIQDDPHAMSVDNWRKTQEEQELFLTPMQIALANALGS